MVVLYLEQNLLMPIRFAGFILQLYKTREENYLLDLQRVSGQAFLFLDLCAAFLMQLGVLN